MLPAWRVVVHAVGDQRGIKLALLVSGTDNFKHSTAEVDKMLVIANHAALLEVATNISASLYAASAHVSAPRAGVDHVSRLRLIVMGQ